MTTIMAKTMQVKSIRIKEESRQIMLDFWQEPANSPRRTRPDGIYTSYTYGEGEQTVQVIMPDLRWNRDALNAVVSWSTTLSAN